MEIVEILEFIFAITFAVGFAISFLWLCVSIFLNKANERFKIIEDHVGKLFETSANVFTKLDNRISKLEGGKQMDTTIAIEGLRSSTENREKK